MDTDKEDDECNRTLEVLTNVVAYVANEVLLLAQYEAIQEDKFARLQPNGDDDSFNKKMNRVTEHLGGHPEFYIVREGAKGMVPPAADSYPESALREACAVFHRARKSVVRAHLFMAGSTLLAEQPEIMNLPVGGESVFISHAQSAFWEHAEAAYIRLYSFWDRVGQVLDFAFFNIRKFDQNGFYSVMDRIAANVAPMHDRLKKSGCWNRLRSFQNSEKEDGLKWLLLRRNLIIHSLHLHPAKVEDDSVFNSQFNHIDKAHRDKLHPREPFEEVALLTAQLEKAGILFDDFLSLVELTPSRKIDPWIRS